jgi:hypothetical protein
MEAVAVSMQQRGERHTGRVAGLTERMLMTFEQLSEGEQLRFVDELEKIDKIGRRTFRLDTETGHGGNKAMIKANRPGSSTRATEEASGGMNRCGLR